MLKVLFRVDDGPGIGSGHMMRTYALAQALRDRGASIELVAFRESALQLDWIGLGAQIQIQARKPGTFEDLDLLIRRARAFNPDYLVLDGYNFSQKWINELGSEAQVVLFDDLGQRDPKVKIVLNQNPGAEKRYESTYENSEHVLLGLNWFQLRRSLFEVAHSPESPRVLLSLGGEDSEDYTVRLMRGLLADGRSFTADVIFSGTEAGFYLALELARERPDRFFVYRGPVDIAAFMQNASVVICGGGVTSLEAACIGVVPVIVVLADNQRPGADYLSSIGAARTLQAGDDGFLDAARTALDLLGDEVLRSRMSYIGRRTIDGLGSNRLASLMSKI
jgi:UDP-2,4-diacetamido-2,4,6-trideoxy-beta-L-altropyranose hydrolase